MVTTGIVTETSSLKKNIEVGLNSTWNTKKNYMIGEDDRRILIDGDYCLEYFLDGTIFLDKSIVVPKHRVKMCHLKTFKNETAEEAAKDFMDLGNNLAILLKSPSLMWFKDELVVSLRLRLSRKQHGVLCWGFRCNHIYLKRFDNKLKQTGQRELITPKTAITIKTNKQKTGPHDARLFQINNTMYSLFATGHRDGWILVIWDHQKQRHFIPEFQKDLLHNGVTVSEKNWVPVVVKDELYIIRHLDLLQVLKCKIHEHCTFVKNDTDALQFQMDDENSPLRGGTSFELL